MKKRREIHGLISSFKYALRGIAYCVVNERNMRIHMVVAAYVVAFSFFYHLDRYEIAILALAIILVLSSEMMNTAVEAVVNLESEYYHHLARISKDVAAGAVLLSALFSVFVGIQLFLRIEVLQRIWAFFLDNPWMFVLLAVSFVLAGLFIFWGPKKAIQRSRRAPPTVVMEGDRDLVKIWESQPKE